MGIATSPALSVEPLQDRHDKSSFVSGVAELDRYLQIQAGQDARRRVAATFVLVEAVKIIAYYTLAAYGIRVAELPADLAKKLPRYPLLPATLLGRLAVTQEFQRQKIGQFMLMDALHRSFANTKDVGSLGVVVDAYDDSAEAFYLHHQFVPLPGQIRKLFLPMKTIGQLFTK